MTTKKCKRCKETKSVDLFYKNSSSRDGLFYICIPCEKKRVKVTVETTCSQCGRPYLIQKAFINDQRRTKAVCTDCRARNRSERNKLQVGDKNPNWRGGATEELYRFYASRPWKNLRQVALRRDNFTCVDCGSKPKKLQVNHIKPRSRFPESKLDINNLETLCKKCHDGKKWQVYAPDEFFEN